MTCDHCLTLLLEAEPHELAGRGASPVAAHVRTCARCGRVAAALGESTAALRNERAGQGASAHERAPVAWRGRMVVASGAAAALAAAWLLFVLTRGSGPVLPATIAVATPATDAPVVAALPAVEAAPSRTPAPVRRTAAPVAVVPVSVTSAPYELPPPITAVARAFAVEPPKVVVLDTVGGTPVRVSLPAGTRAELRASRNPSITVVWVF